MTDNVEVMLRLPEVLRARGASKSTLYSDIKAGKFPAPVKLGERSSGWPASEVRAWQQARIAERDRQTTAA